MKFRYLILDDEGYISGSNDLKAAQAAAIESDFDLIDVMTSKICSPAIDDPELIWLDIEKLDE